MKTPTPTEKQIEAYVSRCVAACSPDERKVMHDLCRKAGMSMRQYLGDNCWLETTLEEVIREDMERDAKSPYTRHPRESSLGELIGLAIWAVDK